MVGGRIQFWIDRPPVIERSIRLDHTDRLRFLTLLRPRSSASCLLGSPSSLVYYSYSTGTTMTRSLAEKIAVAILGGFLTGFILVLCVGNYFRAKRAMERQKQRRLARLSNGGNGFVDSPRSQQSSNTSGASTARSGTEEGQYLLSSAQEAAASSAARRRNHNEEDPIMATSGQAHQARHPVNILSV